MAMSAEELLAEAEKLSLTDRWLFSEMLLVSVQPPAVTAEIEAAQLAEVRRRHEAYERGEVKVYSMEEVMEHLQEHMRVHAAERKRNVEGLYHSLLAAWNAQDAAAMAAYFADDAHMVGFDGSEVDGRAAIESHLAPIFAHHPTPLYVAKVRGVRFLSAGVAALHAVAGMVPRGKTELNPALNAVQTMVAQEDDDHRWRIESFQSTPAAYHGRPEASEQLTAELRDLIARPQ